MNIEKQDKTKQICKKWKIPIEGIVNCNLTMEKLVRNDKVQYTISDLHSAKLYERIDELLIIDLELFTPKKTSI